MEGSRGIFEMRGVGQLCVSPTHDLRAAQGVTAFCPRRVADLHPVQQSQIQHPALAEPITVEARPGKFVLRKSICMRVAVRAVVELKHTPGTAGFVRQFASRTRSLVLWRDPQPTLRQLPLHALPVPVTLNFN